MRPLHRPPRLPARGRARESTAGHRHGERLREDSFDDLAVLKARGIAALFNLVNRLIGGLGVKLENGVKARESRVPR
jgi:hypothetical protein